MTHLAWGSCRLLSLNESSSRQPNQYSFGWHQQHQSNRRLVRLPPPSATSAEEEDAGLFRHVAPPLGSTILIGSPHLTTKEEENTFVDGDGVEQHHQLQLILCRYVKEKEGPCPCLEDRDDDKRYSNRDVLCLDDSVQLIYQHDGNIFFPGSDEDLLVGSKYPVEVLQPRRINCGYTSGDSTAVVTGSYRQENHLHLKLKSRPSSPSSAGAEIRFPAASPFLATLKSAPMSALSVSFAVASSVEEEADRVAAAAATADKCIESQPLLLSALKRQLVGCTFLFRDNGGYGGCGSSPAVTTRMRLRHCFGRTWSFEVKSASSLSSQQERVGGRRKSPVRQYIIVPSTKITLLVGDTSIHTGRVADREANLTAPCGPPRGSTLHSPASTLLIDTIQCIHRLGTTTVDYEGSKFNGNIPRAFLFTGPPGVGKTHAVRVAVEYFGAHKCQLISLRGGEIMSNGPGAARSLERHFQNALHATAGMQKHNAASATYTASVIFLDECEALLSSDHVAATLACLLDKISSNGDARWRRIVVVAATNRVDSLPAYLRRPGRFDKEVPLSPPNAAERRNILQSLLKEQFLSKHDCSLSISEKELSDIADACVGYVPADLELLVRRTGLLMRATAVGMNQESLLSSSLKETMSSVGASALRDAALSAPPKTIWSDVAGDPGGAKTKLQQAIEWPRTKGKAYQRLGLSSPRGILLHGPPGCAKTSLARAAAGASGVAFLSMSPADVYASSYVGDAEAVVRRAFTLARSASPCVLFFDELDSIIGAEGGGAGGGNHGMSRGRSAEARVLSTFLNEMDGVDGSWKDGVLVLAATNRPWTLDAALLRPGRFDKIIYVPPPDVEGRRSILRMQCRHWHQQTTTGSTDDEEGYTPSDSTKTTAFDYDYLSSDAVTGNMTGAEIVGACRVAAMRTIRETIDSKNYGTNPSSSSSDQMSFTKPVLLSQESLEVAFREVQPLLSKKGVMNEFLSFEEHRQQL